MPRRFNHHLAKQLVAGRRDKPSLRQLGVAVGTSGETVRQWLNGTAMPSVAGADRLASYLGVTIDFLMTDDPASRASGSGG